MPRSGLAHTGLCGTSCEDDGATLLDNLESLLRAPDSASGNPSTSHGKESSDDLSQSLHVAWHVQDIGAALHSGDKEVVSVACVSGSIARQVLHGVSCDAYKTCHTSEVLLPNVLIYFNEFCDTEQSLN
jgi:hypothetical protein